MVVLVITFIILRPILFSLYAHRTGLLSILYGVGKMDKICSARWQPKIQLPK